MDAGFAALVGAAIGSVAGIAGQFLLARSLRTRSMADRSLETYVAFLGATHHASLMIGEVARAKHPGGKGQTASERLDPLLDRVNSAFEAVLLVGGAQVRSAASRLDTTLIELDESARLREFTREEWRQHRDPLVNSVLNDFRHEAAKELRKLGRTL